MKKIIFAILLLATSQVQGQEILNLRSQAGLIDEINAERYSLLLPKLMEKEGIDMWVLISREYNEDPILKTMLPAEWLSARRRTMIVFYHDNAKKVNEQLAIARYNVGEKIKAAWDMKQFPDQWDALIDLIVKRNPKKIGLNYSNDYAHADGLTFTEQKIFLDKLPASFKSKVVSAEKLGVAWLETRTEREMQLYPQLIQITHQIIAEGFSEKTIQPGVTTTDDLVWWFRQRIRNLGLDTWFHPSVAIQRNDPENFEHLRAFSNRPKAELIQPGDLLHVDIGISYLRLNTDVQEHAYVLQPGETTAPTILQKAFTKANRLQDILTSQYVIGRTGNQILKGALDQAKKEGIEASIYTHPIGYHGHAAGPTIGLWDQQNGVPGSGDFPLHYNTAYSIELNAATEVPEWKKTIRIMLEEDGFFNEKGFRFIGGRQKELLLIPRQNSTIGN
ncbi:MAG: Xaa-Pro aminopeptidase [Bacteroidetes bacterium 24-39-8]|nr:MAG: Xaa-Pro aminopeptidase [Bacteroidetes bacterium 24-39-8]HQS56023.1 M24 family metallopeptidase [Sediminibacterium sp.]